jgi:RNA polymerase sigma factor (sigma-70 family)
VSTTLSLIRAPRRLELDWWLRQSWLVTARDLAQLQADALASRFEGVRASLLAWFRRRVPDQFEAEDLVQESFLRVVQRGDADQVEHLEGYIYRTATSVLTDRHRRRVVRHADEHLAEDDAPEVANDDDPYSSLVGRRTLAVVAAALDDLPERTKTVFVLRRLEGLRHKEIGVRLGISVSAVEKHMERAIQHLARRSAGWR